MLQITLFCVFVTQCGLSNTQSSSIQDWITKLSYDSAPLTYTIRLEDSPFPDFKRKRSIFEGVGTKEGGSLMAEFIQQFDSDSFLKRVKRTLENDKLNSRIRRDNLVVPATGGPKDLHLKANLRYHHQQRHPNGSVSGSFAQMDPSGQLKVTHYINDDQGFREFPKESDGPLKNADPYINSPSGQVNIVSNSNSGTFPSERDYARSTLQADTANMNFVPNIAPPYNIAPLDNFQPSSIQQSAHGNFQPFSLRSPLFNKYYRPSPEEVQRTYDYHRARTVFDPSQFRPTDVTAVPEIPQNVQPEVRSIYSEYQIPYQVRPGDEPANRYLAFNGPTNDDKQLGPYLYASPILPQNVAANYGQPQDAYAQISPGSPYPQSLEPQTPIYSQPYEQPGFIPASTYSGPYLPNTATFNQPYPANIPIYGSSLPQNLPTYHHPPPQNIPVYQYQQPMQQVYYASATNPQPTATVKM